VWILKHLTLRTIAILAVNKIPKKRNKIYFFSLLNPYFAITYEKNRKNFENIIKNFVDIAEI